MTEPNTIAHHDRLSVPVRRPHVRPLTDEERATLHRVADVLVPRAGGDPAATESLDFDRHLNTALEARSDAFDVIAALLTTAADTRGPALIDLLRALASERRNEFQALSAVVAGAWLLSDSTRDRVGYRGQKSRPAPVYEGTDELADGLLDPVIARGPIYRPTPT